MNDPGGSLRAMPIAEANGQRLHYEVHGEGEPLLCVMGLGVDSQAWALQIRSWSEAYRMVVFDNRDVGSSSYMEAPYEVEDMARDTLGLADELGLDSFHLVGMSLGGAISQEVALAAPDRVRTLTLCVTYGGTGNYGSERARLLGGAMQKMNDRERVEFLMMLTFSEAFYGDSRRVEKMRDLMLANPNPQPAEAFMRQLEAGARHDTRDRLGQLAMPVQVIGAERDLMVPVWKSVELAELIPDAELTILEGRPHAVNIEGAEELNDAVLRFLREHAPAPA
jgi:pimeloyl-ACP methyl ester carboxylesterase